ncbi:PstS family phosphate ABC transporter substrate-binding protein [Pyxidicoccus sp. MSG2]|uniref:PstS family phosphate ABC transporter substrate-binding protein n=1 Tax=Pyxidicoccus sp. MSG2 TaxID=2996790 RepID=UPI00226E397E|nr:PstS family phosphate ABC transporter substrate-binding protein [Pyxidicoccus sp. MSG2]MCY1023998.1 PstS family phosphate ABC transporter substrate-binding protein [Pyxidicoccus sp. MSG2]
MRRTYTAAAVAIAVGLGGCKKESAPSGDGASTGAQAKPATMGSGTVKVDGSSTVYPITEAVAEEFQKASREVKVTVGISGTGGGFKKFCNGETDISNASRPIKPSEVELCQKNGIEYIELPIAYDGLAVLVNPANTWATSMTVAELKKMWEPEAQGKVMKWSDVRPGWPDAELRLYGAGVDSGTYDYFTEAIVKKEHSSRGDFTSSEDDNVIVQGIANDKNALGFFGYAYYSENKDKLKLVPIDDEKADNGAGPVAPSGETVRNGTYQPLSRPIFIYVARKSLERPEVGRFVKFYTANAEKLVPEVGYIPLPTNAYSLAQARVDARKTGSLFGGKGSQVGVSIEQLLAKEATSEGQQAQQ